VLAGCEGGALVVREGGKEVEEVIGAEGGVEGGEGGESGVQSCLGGIREWREGALYYWWG
jgi:hypothetical protein